jgi:hypothetical protein
MRRGILSVFYVADMKSHRHLSDVAIDSVLIASAAVSSAMGAHILSPAFLGTMIALAMTRRFVPRYRAMLAALSPAFGKVDQSRMGKLWAEYLHLKQQAAAEKRANFGGTLQRAWLLYGMWLGAAAYWTMPFIIGVAGQMLSGQYFVILMLVALHHLSIFAQYAEIRAWARKRDQSRRPI